MKQGEGYLTVTDSDFDSALRYENGGLAGDADARFGSQRVAQENPQHRRRAGKRYFC